MRILALARPVLALPPTAPERQLRPKTSLATSTMCTQYCTTVCAEHTVHAILSSGRASSRSHSPVSCRHPASHSPVSYRPPAPPSRRPSRTLQRRVLKSLTLQYTYIQHGTVLPRVSRLNPRHPMSLDPVHRRLRDRTSRWSSSIHSTACLVRSARGASSVLVEVLSALGVKCDNQLESRPRVWPAGH